ncbi:MAG TPA: SDR family oxidoreductase [Phycisphaerales bacterium]|nr:SDR family oxidoreductase [Phycisphaerales bacterium]HMP36892.1 SDR family oxidoreductase [Phycisphaerales bacterium]
MGRLDSKIALVTGAARGIGAAIAEAFVREGASVVLADIRDGLGAEVAARLGAAATYRSLDVRDEAAWDRAIAEIIGRFGRLDALVNCAGITGFDEDPRPQDAEHCSLSTWHAVHRTNLDGVFLGCRAAIRAMRPAARGSIVNIGSRSGVVGIPAAVAYASSKAAVRNHTRSVALYCAEQGLAIRCNVVQPAAILTPMWDPLLGDGGERAARIAEYCRDAPLGRFGTPEEVAALVVHLAADESAYTTGAEFTVDGGMLAGTAVPPRRPAEGADSAD